jgi:hypothetical protein
MTKHLLKTLSNSTAYRLTPNGVHSGMDITIQNVDSSAYVYLGGEDVATDNFGYRLSPGTAWSVELPGQDALYAITDTDESQIAMLWTGLE